MRLRTEGLNQALDLVDQLLRVTLVVTSLIAFGYFARTLWLVPFRGFGVFIYAGQLSIATPIWMTTLVLIAAKNRVLRQTAQFSLFAAFLVAGLYVAAPSTRDDTLTEAFRAFYLFAATYAATFPLLWFRLRDSR